MTIISLKFCRSMLAHNCGSCLPFGQDHRSHSPERFQDYGPYLEEIPGLVPNLSNLLSSRRLRSSRLGMCFSSRIVGSRVRRAGRTLLLRTSLLHMGVVAEPQNLCCGNTEVFY